MRLALGSVVATLIAGWALWVEWRLNKMAKGQRDVDEALTAAEGKMDTVLEGLRGFITEQRDLIAGLRGTISDLQQQVAAGATGPDLQPQVDRLSADVARWDDAVAALEALPDQPAPVGPPGPAGPAAGGPGGTEPGISSLGGALDASGQPITPSATGDVTGQS